MRLIDISEVAKRLGLSRSGVRKMVATGQVLKPMKLGRCVRWDAAELESWIDKGCPRTEKWERIKGGK